MNFLPPRDMPRHLLLFVYILCGCVFFLALPLLSVFLNGRNGSHFSCAIKSVSALTLIKITLTFTIWVFVCAFCECRVQGHIQLKQLGWCVCIKVNSYSHFWWHSVSALYTLYTTENPITELAMDCLQKPNELSHSTIIFG